MKTKDLTQAGLIAALVFIGTRFLMLPVPGAGYIHLGDTFMLLSGLLIGGPLGGLASGLGAMLADLTSGYAIYAIPTFIIKFLQALFVTFAFNKLVKSKVKNNEKPKKLYTFFFVSLCSGVIMLVGYFVFGWVVYGLAVAISALIYNVIQVAASAVIATILLFPTLTIKNIINN